MSDLVRSIGDRRRGGTENIVRTRGHGLSRPPIPPIAITWARYLRTLGPVTAHDDLSDFTEEWQDWSPGYQIDPTPGSVLDRKMQPIRYEIGLDAASVDEWNVVNYQQDVGLRSTAPPVTGHLRSTVVTQLTLPSMLLITTNGGGLNVNSSVLRAVEVFHNSASLGLVDLSSASPMSDHHPATNSVYTHEAVTVLLADPLPVVESDTFRVDYYLHLTGTAHPFTPIAVAYALPWTVLIPTAGFFKAMSSVTRFTRASSHKVVFADHGPDGFSELELKPQAGWVFTTPTTSSVTLTTEDGSYSLTFDWGHEIPFIEIDIPAQEGSPSVPFMGVMRYRPESSGDYDPIVFSGAPSMSFEYGIWNPSESTVFTHPQRYANYSAGSGLPKWYPERSGAVSGAALIRTVPSNYFDEFPSAISLEQI